MKIIRNNIIPFKGFAAINLFGILFVRNDATITLTMIRHESIHTEQMKEMLYIFFYLWYVIEWFIKLFKYGDETGGKSAYNQLSFEREAYANEENENYLANRKHYAWFKYITKEA